jgi:DNA polymerase-3 subunit beta
MKVVLNRSSFLEVFNLAASGCSGQVKDVLGYVHLDADVCQLQSSNGDVALIVEFRPEEIHSGGACLLDPRRVGAILKESRSDLITLEADNKSISLTTDEGSFTLQTLDSSEFPKASAITKPGIEVAATAFIGALRRVDFATDIDSTRYQLGGVNFVTTDEQLDLIATDGRRLAHQRLDLHLGGALDGQSNIVPTKALGIAKRALEGSEGFIGIAIEGSVIELRGGQVRVQIRMVEGRYPNWQSVIPAAAGKCFEFPAGPFLQATRQASVVMADKDSRGILFSFAGGTCRITGAQADVGKSQVSILISGDSEVAITMDFRFVLDWLQTLDKADQVSLWVASADKPTLWLCGCGKYVIMPMSRS